MCDCFHLAFPNWHAASSGTGGGRRLQGPESATEDDSVCDEPPGFTEGERPRPQGSSPIEDYPESDKFNSDEECKVEHDPQHKSGSGKKAKKSGLGCMFEKRSTPKMSKLKEAHSPESEVIVKTAKDGCAEGLVYSGGGKDGIYIKGVVPESPASKSLKLKEGDQILSATVYFDNVPYEDAIQILEHAQAYKMKLCLKRKPDITQTDNVIEPNVIPEEEELKTPEMRKTKRRGDARISWPKFPSLGKGKKNRFTRSHSSSEADEQRKLELSPTTSDTESPIKSQDALRGKKKHKMKLSVLTKRGRISSSEDQDTDAATSAQVSSDVQQTQEMDMLSPEYLKDAPQVFVTEHSKIIEDRKTQQNYELQKEAQSPQHKTELISIDSTLKTADLTVALSGPESSSGITPSDGKKKKKERSELKIQILGKDKSQKKAKSPKRLKTLGASLEVAGGPESQKSDGVTSQEMPAKRLGDQTLTDIGAQVGMGEQKREHNISEVSVTQEDTQKEKTQKTKKFKLPRFGSSQTPKEENIKNSDVKEFTANNGQLSNEIAEDPYEKLAKRNQLPKREEIEIPGMEDMSKAKSQQLNKSKAGLAGENDQSHSETVQLCIDVDSVKEAVSKLPGYKLPKVDTSGVPIPEEITVIDANAQRISVKTPTKVVESRTTHEKHYIKYGPAGQLENANLPFKLPKMRSIDRTTEELLFDTKEQKTKSSHRHGDNTTTTHERDNIMLPGHQRPHAFEHIDHGIQGQKTIFLQDDRISNTIRGKEAEREEEFVIGVKMPEIEGIEFIDSADCYDVSLVTKAKDEFSNPEVGSKHEGVLPQWEEDLTIEHKPLEFKKETNVLFQLPKAGIEMSKKESLQLDTTLIKEDGKIHLSETNVARAHDQLFVQEPQMDTEKSEIEIKPIQKEGKVEKDIQGPAFKFQIPTFVLPKLEVGTFSAKSSEDRRQDKVHGADNKILEDASTVNIAVHSVDVGPSIEIKTDKIEQEEKGNKLKMPNLGFSMPKEPEIVVSLSKKDTDASSDEAKAEIKLPKVDFKEVTSVKSKDPQAEVDVEMPHSAESTTGVQDSKFIEPKIGITMHKASNKGTVGLSSTSTITELESTSGKGDAPNVEMSKTEKDITLVKTLPVVNIPEAEVSIEKGDILKSNEQAKEKIPGVQIKLSRTDGESDEKGGKFKIPTLGIAVPNVDFIIQKKEINMNLAEVKAEGNVSDVELNESSVEADTKAPKSKVVLKDTKESALKFKIPKFKLPKFGVGPQTSSPEEVLKVDIEAPNIYSASPSISTKTKESTDEVKEKNFNLPSLDFKGAEEDIDISKKEVDVTLPKAKVEVKLSEAKPIVPVKLEFIVPEFKVETKDSKESSMKFKTPAIQLTKCGVDNSSSTADVTDKDEAKIIISSEELRIKTHVVDTDVPSINLKVKGSQQERQENKTDVILPETKDEDTILDGTKVNVDIKALDYITKCESKESKFKFPELGISVPNVKGPELNLSLSKEDAKIKPVKNVGNVKLTESKMDRNQLKIDIKPPEVEIEVDEPGSKFKMPKFGIKLPKIESSFSKKEGNLKPVDADVNLEIKPTAEILTVNIPELEAGNLDVQCDIVDIPVPEDVLKVNTEASTIENKVLPIDRKTKETENERKMGKFKFPSLGFKGPDIDLSKTDVDVNLPEANVSIEIPDVNVKRSSAEVEIKAVEISQSSDVEGSPSKFKLPTFKLPKFGATSSQISEEEHNTDKNTQNKGADLKLQGVAVEVKLPKSDPKENAASDLVSEVEAKSKMPGWTMPRFSFSKGSTKAPEVDKNIEASKADITLPEANIEVNLDIKKGLTISSEDGTAPDIDAKLKKPRFSLPKISFTKPSIKSSEVDVVPSQVDVSLPEVNVKVKEPHLTQLEGESQVDGEEKKSKLLSLGLKQPDIEISKKNVDANLPEAKVAVEIPDFEVKKTSTEIRSPEIKVPTNAKEGSPLRFKMPTFKLPKFGVRTKSLETEIPDTDTDIRIDGAEKELNVNIELPIVDPNVSLDVKTKEIEQERETRKFKLPSLGFKGPDVDLSKADIDMKLPEANDKIGFPDVDHKKLSAEVKIEAPDVALQTRDIEDSPLKFKLPTIRLPKFGATAPVVSVEEPAIDKNIEIKGADLKLEGAMVEDRLPEFEVKGPSIAVSLSESEAKSKKSGWTMPSFSFSKASAKAPEAEIILEAPKADITWPEIKSEINLEINDDVIISTEDGTAPDFDAKFKKPKFYLPKISFSKPSTKAPECDVNILQVDASLTDVNVEVKQPDFETRKIPVVDQENKFKLPSLGYKGPDADLSKPDLVVKLPEANVEVELPDVELRKTTTEITSPKIKLSTKDKDGSPSRFKLPTFKMPKFGVRTKSLDEEIPDINTDIKVDGAQITVAEEVLTVNIVAPIVDPIVSSIDMKTKEVEHEKGDRKFKIPSLGFKGPDVDLSKTDLDMDLPEATVEVELPNVKLKKKSTEIKSPDVKDSTNDTDGSPLRFKMPTFKLPKFGVRTKSLEEEYPAMDTDIKAYEADITVPEEVIKVDIQVPKCDTKVLSIETKDIEHEKRDKKFKLPSLGFKKPDIDLSKTAIDVNVPEAKVEVDLPNVDVKTPSVEVEIIAPGVALQTGDVEASPSKFKLPTIRLPTFGATAPVVSVEEPDIDKNIDIKGADLKLEGAKVEVNLPEFEVKGPSASISLSESEAKSKKSGWRMPSFSFSKASAQAPEAEIILEAPKADITLPEAQTDIDLEINKGLNISTKDGNAPDFDAKLKKPRFSLPRISFSKPSAKAPEIDVDLPQVDVSLPDIDVKVQQPDMVFDQQKCEIQVDSEEKKLKLSGFGFKGPAVEIPKPDLDVKLPETKVKVELPDVRLNQTSTEIESSEIKVFTKDKDGSPSRFKFPTFKMPTFGIGTQSLEADIPDIDNNTKEDGALITIPEEVLTVNIVAPIVDPIVSSIDMKTKEAEHEKGDRKFKIPNLGFKGPDVELSKTDLDMNLPEATVEVELPNVKLKKKSTEVKSPDVKDSTNDTDGSPLRFKMPTFKLPKFGVRTKSLEEEYPAMDTDIKAYEADITVPEEVINVDIQVPKCDTKVLSIETKDIEHEKRDKKFKLPSLGFKKPDIDLSKTDIDVNVPEVKVEVDLPNVDVKTPSVEVEIIAPGVALQTRDVEASPSKFKLPTIRLPKFGATAPVVSVEEPDIHKNIDIKGTDLKLKGAKVKVNLPEFEVKGPSTSVSLSESEAKSKKSGWTMPSFSFSKASAQATEAEIILEAPKADITLPEAKTDVDLEMNKGLIISTEDGNVPDFDAKLKKPRFSLPRISFSKPSAKAPEIDVDLPQVDVSLPDIDVKVQQPDMVFDQQKCEIQVNSEEKKLKLSGFGFKGPAVEISKPDLDVKLPETKVKVELPDVRLNKTSTEIESSEIKVFTKDKDESPSRFKFPTFKMPTFGIGTQSLEADIPDIDNNTKEDGSHITIPEEVLTVNIEAPIVDPITLSVDSVEVELPNVELKKTSTEIKCPKDKVSTNDTDGSPLKFKMPTFKFPKFGVRTKSQDAEVPDMDTDIKVDGAEIPVPEEVLTVNIEAPDVDPIVSSNDMKTKGGEHEKGGRKFKIPSLGFKGPDVDLSKTDLDINLPEANTEIDLPNVELKDTSTETKSPEIKVPINDKDESPSRFKMPTFKLPKFGFQTKNLEEEYPAMDTDIKTDEGDITVPEEVINVDIQVPTFDTKVLSIDLETKDLEHEKRGRKFKLPTLGFKGPDVDLSKTDVDMNLPEGNIEVELPNVELKETHTQIKSPEIKVSINDKDEVPSRFKMPTFKLPKFGVRRKSLEAEYPALVTDIKSDEADIPVPEEVINVDIQVPPFDAKVFSIDVEKKEIEHEKRERKFKLPSLGFIGPDADLSKTDVDVNLQEAKVKVELKNVEVKTPSVDVEIIAPDVTLQTSDVEGSPSKFKLSTIRLPKFGATAPVVSAEEPDIDKNIDIKGADLKLEGAKVEVNLPEFEVKGPSTSISLSESEAKSKKSGWTMPSFSFSKASAQAPEAEIILEAPKADITLPEVKTDIDLEIDKGIIISTEDGNAPDIDAKLKKPRFSLPKISFSKPSAKAPEIDVDLPQIDVSLSDFNVESKQPGIVFDQPVCEIQVDSKEKKFKLPSLGFKAPEVNLTKPDIDMKLPEAKVKDEPPNVDSKDSSNQTKSSEIKFITKDKDQSPSRFKLPSFKIPKFGVGIKNVDVEVTDVERDIAFPDEELTVNIEAPNVDATSPSIDVKMKGIKQEKNENAFKLPSLGFKGLDVDVISSGDKAEVQISEVEMNQPSSEVEIKGLEVRVSAGDFNGSQPEIQMPEATVVINLPKVEINEMEGTASEPDALMGESTARGKRPSWTFPKFSFSKTSEKSPIAAVNIEKAILDDTLSNTDSLAYKHDTEKIGCETKLSEVEEGHKQGSTFRLHNIDSGKSEKEVNITKAAHEAEVNLPKSEVKEAFSNTETKPVKSEGKSKDIRGSPLKFKMPTLKMPQFSSAAHDDTAEATTTEKVPKAEEMTSKEEVTDSIKEQSVGTRTDLPKKEISTMEMPKDQKDGLSPGSPSRFKLSLFKMPKLGFSRAKSEDENVPADIEEKQDPLEVKVEPKEENKSPKLLSFDKMIETIDVEFGVPKEEKVEDGNGNVDVESPKSPEKAGWFKFPKLSLSSPPEAIKTTEKTQQKEMSPAGETGDEEISPISSVESSDAFADVSSTLTSEPVGPSLSSPTRVTVKYTDPVPEVTGHEEIMSTIISSRAGAEFLSDVPDLPEKITILSSTASSSSEETLRLKSSRIHVISSNIQATPEAECARLLTAVQIQSAEGLPQSSNLLWRVDDSEGNQSKVFEKHLLTKTSEERSKSKETIVITKQITRRVFESSDTASSMQRLRDSVHSEKMRFFDEAEK